MDKKWIFETPDFRRHGSKKDGQVKYNPSLGRRRRKNIDQNIRRKNLLLEAILRSPDDDAAFVYLSRKDIH